jgi:hypothetical protein
VGQGYIQANTGTKKSRYGVKDAVENAILSGVGEVAHNAVSKVAQKTEKAKELAHDAKKANNIVNNGKPRPAQIKKAETATNKAKNYGKGNVSETVKAVGKGYVNNNSHYEDEKNRQKNGHK